VIPPGIWALAEADLAPAHRAANLASRARRK